MRIESGVDAAEISRVARSMERESFMRRYFSEEAFSKAMGTGIRGFGLREVSILHDGLGRPYFHLAGRAAELAEGWGLSLSITHTRDTATAFVVAWREEEEP